MVHSFNNSVAKQIRNFENGFSSQNRKMESTQNYSKINVRNVLENKNRDMLFVMFCDILILNVFIERSAHLRPQGAMLPCVRLIV